jgi:hypothetical protein
MAPGRSAQLAAILHASDGTTTDVSAQAAWHSSASFMVSVSLTGLATTFANRHGESTVQVSARGLTATTEIVVVPEGSFRLIGRVVERGTEMAVPHADVEIDRLAGAARPVQISADGDGRFRFYGVPPGVTLRVARGGYNAHSEHLTLTEHRSIEIGIEPAVPRGEFGGRYSLVMTASPSCAGALPEPLRSRRYEAFVDQPESRPADLRVTLGGARFQPHAFGFVGHVRPDNRVRFGLTGYDFFSPYYYYAPSLAEIIDERLLVISGEVQGEAEDLGSRGRRIDGVLDGAFTLLGADGGFTARPTLAQCAATDHTFLMTEVR